MSPSTAQRLSRFRTFSQSNLGKLFQHVASSDRGFVCCTVMQCILHFKLESELMATGLVQQSTEKRLHGGYSTWLQKCYLRGYQHEREKVDLYPAPVRQCAAAPLHADWLTDKRCPSMGQDVGVAWVRQPGYCGCVTKQAHSRK